MHYYIKDKDTHSGNSKIISPDFHISTYCNWVDTTGLVVSDLHSQTHSAIEVHQTPP